MPQLNYDDMSAISYVASDVAVLLSPAQQSLAIQALNLFNSRIMWQDWNDNQAVIDELVAATLLALDTPVTIPPNTSPREHTHWHVNSIKTVGNNISLFITASQIMNHYAAQSAGAQNDQWISPSFHLAGGFTYTLEQYAVKAATSGIVTYDVRRVSDNALLAQVNQDLYSAATVFNFKFSLTFDLTEDTEVYIAGTIQTKNASSGGYVCALTCAMVRS